VRAQSPTDHSLGRRARSNRRWLDDGVGLRSNKVGAPPNVAIAPATSGRASDELLETAKGLQVTQQQAVDQPQVVQDQLVAQKAEDEKTVRADRNADRKA
jgi:hypothetical protein